MSPPHTHTHSRLLSVRLSVSLIEMLAHTKERGTRACCVSRNDTVSQTGSRTDTQQPHMAAHAVGGFPADGMPAGSPSTLVLYHGSKITHVSLVWCFIMFPKGVYRRSERLKCKDGGQYFPYFHRQKRNKLKNKNKNVVT